jgi:hypothetical protein
LKNKESIHQSVNSLINKKKHKNNLLCFAFSLKITILQRAIKIIFNFRKSEEEEEQEQEKQEEEQQ